MGSYPPPMDIECPKESQSLHRSCSWTRTLNGAQTSPRGLVERVVETTFGIVSSNQIVDSRLFSSTLFFSWTIFFKCLVALDQTTWPFGSSPTFSLIIILGVITSLLNHGLTHRVYQWLDRITMSVLVSMTLVPTLWTSDFQWPHVWIFFACLCFVWSKLNADQEDIRVKSHQTSHVMAALSALTL